jgi:hypothetical protein
MQRGERVRPPYLSSASREGGGGQHRGPHPCQGVAAIVGRARAVLHAQEKAASNSLQSCRTLRRADTPSISSTILEGRLRKNRSDRLSWTGIYPHPPLLRSAGSSPDSMKSVYCRARKAIKRSEKPAVPRGLCSAPRETTARRQLPSDKL